MQPDTWRKGDVLIKTTKKKKRDFLILFYLKHVIKINLKHISVTLR